MRRKLLLAALVLVMVVIGWMVYGRLTAIKPGEISIAQPRQQVLRPMTLLYSSATTSLDKIGPTIEPMMKALSATIRENRIEHTGGVVFIYHGMTQDPTKQFKLDVGMIVADGTVAPAGFQVRKTDAFFCQTVLYTGPMSRIGDAWGKLYPSIFAGGHTPTDETREMYLYWEGADSPNNVVQLQVGVK